MHTLHPHLRPFAAGALLFVAAISAAAQTNAGDGSARTASTATAGTAGGNLKILNLSEYGRWNRITSTGLSPDGKWMTYAYVPNDGDATLYVKSLDGDKLYTIPVGSAPVFSDDSKWVDIS